MIQPSAQLGRRVEETSAPRPADPLPWIWLPRAAAVAGTAWFILHSLFVIFGPEARVMEWLYDDAFYYLVAAKHLSQRHISSFDGVTVTSGYHPLWMWACAFVFGFRDKLDLTFVRACMALTFCITAAILLLALRYAWRGGRTGMLLALGLAASSYSALNNGVTAMEWPLVLLSWFLLHLFLARKVDEHAPPSSRNYAAAALLGLLGSFSRTDFGLIPAAYLAAAVLTGLRARSWRRAYEAAAAVAGAAVALPLIFLYNHRMTGAWLQSSAEVKRLAASISSPFNPVPAFWQFARVLLYLPALSPDPAVRAVFLSRGLVFLLLIFILLAAWALLRGRTVLRQGRQFLAESSHDPGYPAIAAALFGVAAYVMLDGFNSQATFGWYSASVTGFVVILAAFCLRWVGTLRGSLIVLPLIAANIAAAIVFGGNAKTQMDEVYVGKAMRADHPNAVMAGGDVGKPSFYNDGTMFNLDGLMNNEVVPYLAAGRIHCYALQRRLEYISDIGSITMPVTDAERARHGEPPLPWDLYFPVVYSNSVFSPSATAGPMTYRRTDFDAIRKSGECPSEK